LNFVPVIGIARLIVSNNFFTMQYAKTNTILYGIYNQNYLFTAYADTEINTGFVGNVMWIAGAVVWVGMTITQKYPRRKPEWKDFFYNLVGIFLFYLGLTSALNIVSFARASLP
jgi:drug/metabolite transporter (DMT)-like permease